MSKISGLILAGGHNSRMGGQKKLFLTLHREPFYSHIRRAMTPLELVRLSVEAEEPYQTLGMELVVDDIGDIGPIGGIFSGLHHCDEEAMFVTSCDAPFLREETVRGMLAMYEENPLPTLVRIGERLSPLPGIYPKTLLPVLEQMIEEENYRLMQIFRRFGQVQYYDLPEDAPEGKNINTVEEYEAVCRED